MPLLANHGQVGAIVAVAVAVLMWTACGDALADELAAAPMAQESAPIGHRQPNVLNVPENVLREENATETRGTKLDKELNICRGC